VLSGRLKLSYYQWVPCGLFGGGGVLGGNEKISAVATKQTDGPSEHKRWKWARKKGAEKRTGDVQEKDYKTKAEEMLAPTPRMKTTLGSSVGGKRKCLNCRLGEERRKE